MARRGASLRRLSSHLCNHRPAQRNTAAPSTRRFRMGTDSRIRVKKKMLESPKWTKGVPWKMTDSQELGRVPIARWIGKSWYHRHLSQLKTRPSHRAISRIHSIPCSSNHLGGNRGKELVTTFLMTIGNLPQKTLKISQCQSSREVEPRQLRVRALTASVIWDQTS